MSRSKLSDSDRKRAAAVTSVHDVMAILREHWDNIEINVGRTTEDGMGEAYALEHPGDTESDDDDDDEEWKQGAATE